uniref:Uncharacterized protein n=1 Tax=Oryza sativa subsp. japonica TaxID=39947 RepID=Q5SNC7_ORYSJ|nr:hypothetical protein [Oryza sativa Japonica Group]
MASASFFHYPKANYVLDDQRQRGMGGRPCARAACGEQGERGGDILLARGREGAIDLRS